jgi:hypothetical protein
MKTLFLRYSAPLSGLRRWPPLVGPLVGWVSGKNRLSPEPMPRVPANTHHSNAVRQHFGHLCYAVDSLLVADRNLDDLQP